MVRQARRKVHRRRTGLQGQGSGSFMALARRLEQRTLVVVDRLVNGYVGDIADFVAPTRGKSPLQTVFEGQWGPLTAMGARLNEDGSVDLDGSRLAILGLGEPIDVALSPPG